MEPVFRFAPSPNGNLHLGHVRSVLLNAERARASGGRFLLRIEDIDAARCRPAYETAIYEDLAWLGVRWEEPVRRQSDHLADYRRALALLEARGLIYPSFESRADIAAQVMARETEGPWPRDPDGAPLYPGLARSLPPAERRRRIAAGEPYALRLDTAKALEVAWAGQGVGAWQEAGRGPAGETGVVAGRPQAWGDVILARKDAPAAYHLAVVVDDSVQGVTHVVRGADLFWATSVHRLLQTVLDLPAPAYEHHALVLDETGAKLAKSTQATAVRDLRRQGLTAADVRRMAGLDRAILEKGR